MLRIGRAAAVLVLVFASIGCGDDESPVPAGTTATAPSTTATTEPAPAALEQALWPDPADATGGSPVAVARSFVKDYIGVPNPALGAFREGEPNAGEVTVYGRGEDGRRLPGVASTLSLRKLDGEHWFVTSAQSPEVEIAAPHALDEIASPVRIAGRGRGFEGNVVLQVRSAFATDAIVKKPVIAGSAEALEPFATALPFAAEGASAGAIVAQTGSGIEGGGGFTAFPVGFAR